MRISTPTRLVVLLTIFLLGAITTVSAQQTRGGSIKFCNNGDTDLLFNLVSREGMGILNDSWRAHGRYPVDAHSCEYFAEDVSVAVQIFVGIRRNVGAGNNPDVLFDVSGSGSEVRSVDEAYCTKRESFDRVASLAGQSECPTGYSLQPFRIAIVLPTRVNYTLNVTDPGSGSSTPPAGVAQSQSSQPAAQPQNPGRNPYIADDEDPHRAEAMRAEQQAAAKRTQDEAIAYNKAWTEFIEKTYAGMEVCQTNKDMAVMTTCMQEFVEHVKEKTSACNRERDHQRGLACLDSVKLDVNATAMKWSGEEIFGAGDFLASAPINSEKDVSTRPADIQMRTDAELAPAAQVQTAQTETARRKPEVRQQAPATVARSAPDLASLRLRYQTYATNLSAGRHDLVQIEGSAGLSYGYGFFMGAYGRCPHLKTTDIPITRIYMIVQKKFWLDVVGLDDKVVNFEDAVLPVLLTAQWMTFVSGGVADGRAVVSEFGCNKPETRQMVASAEKLTMTLLTANVGKDGVMPYKRPAILAGLPEETQRLYDEYHFCKLRTGQTDHLGSFGPCDEAFYQFKLSRARATGMPEPTEDPVNYWVSSKGPVGLYEERTYGTDVIFYEAPTNFTPAIPDAENVKLPLHFKMQFNEGKRDRIWKVNLSAFGAGGVYGKNYMYYQGAARDIVFKDYMDIGGDRNDVLLECLYYGDGRTVGAVFYWYKTVPKLADPDRLRSRMTKHPVLLVMEPREECPPVLTAETRRKRQALLDSIR